MRHSSRTAECPLRATTAKTEADPLRTVATSHRGIVGFARASPLITDARMDVRRATQWRAASDVVPLQPSISRSHLGAFGAKYQECLWSPLWTTLPPHQGSWPAAGLRFVEVTSRESGREVPPMPYAGIPTARNLPRARSTAPTAPMPISVKAQVSGSGTGVTGDNWVNSASPTTVLVPAR
jgi:hypothetical protein